MSKRETDRKELSVGVRECLETLAKAVESSDEMQTKVLAADALLRYKAHTDQMELAASRVQLVPKGLIKH